MIFFKIISPSPNWDGLLELGTAGVLCRWYRQCVKIYERKWLLDCSDIIDYLKIARTLLQDDYLETQFILYRPQLRTILAAPTILIRAGELDIRYNILTTWCGRLSRSLSHVSAVRHVPYVGWAIAPSSVPPSWPHLSQWPPPSRWRSGRPPLPIYSRTQPRHVRPPFQATSFGDLSK